MISTSSPVIQPAPVTGLASGRTWTVGLIEQVRLILRGGSVIDWYRMGFETEDEVRDFLRVNGVDTEVPEDVRRLRALLRMANEYLSTTLDLKIPKRLWAPSDPTVPFLAASQPSSPGGKRGSDDQTDACILLKTVHTIHHLEARELRLSLALSELDIFALVERRVARAMTEIQALGYAIVVMTGSRKTRQSVITKLLSKRRATATEILDRLRFRVICETTDDVVSVLAEMTRHLFPFNYAVPEETTNDLLDFSSWFDRHVASGELERRLQFDLELERKDPLRRDHNECSATEFRMLNFVVDLPVRIDHLMDRPENAHLRHLGRIVFLNVEFQMFDRLSWDRNERNEATSHTAYKERQRERVRQRLTVGIEPHNNALKVALDGALKDVRKRNGS